MSTQELLRVLGKQYCPNDEQKENIAAIWKKQAPSGGGLWAAVYIFNYGVIVGTQQERARRKKSKENQK